MALMCVCRTATGHPRARPTSATMQVYVHVDPKAYFSAERTFIQWMHIALTVGSIALSLSTLADSDSVRTAGALLRIVLAYFQVMHAFSQMSTVT